MLGIESKHEPIKGEYAERLREEIETIENNRRMKTVYAIAETRTLKHITGARAGQISHTFGYKSHWDETLKKSIEYFNTREEADAYLEQQLDGYLNITTTEGYHWKLATRSLGAFAVSIEWGKSTKHITVDSMNIVALIIED